MVSILSFHVHRWGFIAGWYSTCRTVSMMHTQSTMACRDCTDVSVCRLASFDVRVFANNSPECLSHPTNPGATTILCGPTKEDKVYFGQGTPKHGPWERGFRETINV
ncbi:hypothetical protein AVEN_155993-1 [Araneus ventricosus]|uniref:Uncharacterized protein n=1 Tax=Araneus ventricosus TaxID=182803 RepID=A0A4Y2FT82_ARAVE|nr:hypothetical protein AVEN_155993-1 [Araneus ventricosus]